MEINIEPLFITPVITAKELYLFTEEEFRVLTEKILIVDSGKGNERSINDKILDLPQLSNVRKFIERGIKSYVKQIIDPTNTNLEFYIVNSWSNYTQLNGRHDIHYHSNSLFSGCLYVLADKEFDTITFHNRVYKGIDIESKSCSYYNASSCTIPIESGRLIMFDSSIDHSVNYVETKRNRISLSFNVFVKGEIVCSNYKKNTLTLK
mgnify:CR=1 FL=1